MKLINYISICGFALCLLSACDTDLEKVTYDEGTVKPAILQEVESSYILKEDDANKVAITFNWSKPDAGYQAAITNELEMDLVGNEFKKKIVLASGTNNEESEVSVITLNRGLMNLLNNVIPSDPIEVEFRVVSSISTATNSFTSNIIKTMITPYSMEKEYPFIAVRGDYSGWDFLKSQKVYSKDENHDYAGLIFFGAGKSANGWKLCGDEGWSVDNWGFGTGSNEAEEVTLIANSNDNIKSYSKTSYYVEFNNESGKLKMTKGHNSWGVNKKGTSTDMELVLTMSTINGITTHALTATIDLQAGDNWRIRPDNADTDAVTPSDVEHALSTEGDYFKVEEDGTYVITWLFNKVTPQLSIKKQ